MFASVECRPTTIRATDPEQCSVDHTDQRFASWSQQRCLLPIASGNLRIVTPSYAPAPGTGVSLGMSYRLDQVCDGLLAGPQPHAALIGQPSMLYRDTDGGVAVVVPALLYGAVAGGYVDAVLPTVDPGCCVGFSVPEACGRLCVVFAVDSLEPPAGGFCVVVSGFCASAGVAPRIANATISVFMTVFPLLLVDVKACRAGLIWPAPPRCRASSISLER